MSRRIVLAELNAGTAPLSLLLAGGRSARILYPRQGNKQGIREALARAMRLHGYAGSVVDRYVWADPDPGVRLMLRAYTEGYLASCAAALLMKWGQQHSIPELWEKLLELYPRVPRDALLPPTRPEDVQRIQAPALAAYLYLANGAYRRGDPSSGYDPIERRAPESRGTPRHPALTLADRLRVLPVLPPERATTYAEAEDRQLWALLADEVDSGARVVVYLDPTYTDESGAATTGYQQNMSQQRGLDLARYLEAQGCEVYLSSGHPLDPPDGWHTIDLTDERTGQARSAGTQEWLLCSRAPGMRRQQRLIDTLTSSY